jgi:hypothetical protein
MQFIAFSAIMQDRTCAEILINGDDGLPISYERVKINLQLAELWQL